MFEIPEKIKLIITWAGIALIAVGPILALLAFGNYYDQVFLAMIVAFASRMGSFGNNIWQISFLIMIKLNVSGIFIGTVLSLVGVGLITFLFVYSVIDEGITYSLQLYLLWVGVGLSVAGPIIMLIGFRANFNAMTLSYLIGLAGLVNVNPVNRFVGLYFFVSAPITGFILGIALTFQGFTIALISKLMEMQE